MAIGNYLLEIAKQRDILKENLASKEVSVEGCETFNSLISKIPEISVTEKTGVQNGVWTPTITCDSFSLTGLKFIPAKLAICCEDVLTKNYTSVAEYINIALLNIELSLAEIQIIKNSAETGIVVETGDVSADIIIEESDGLYSLTVSFTKTNETLDIPYSFKANASHVWCVSEEGWLI